MTGVGEKAHELADDLSRHFSKGGRAGKSNHVLDAAKALAGTKEAICALLAGWYDEARKCGDSKRANDVRTAQKISGCSGGSKQRGQMNR
jgi:hypothetical protein